MADSDLTTAQVVADELGVGVGDLRIPRLIAVASDAIRRYLNRPRVHYHATLTEKVPARPVARLLVLGLTPVAAIASVQLEDGSLVSADEYELADADAGLLYRDAGWPFTGQVRPGLLYADPAVGSERPALTVTYSGGWVTPAQAASSGWAGPERTLPYDLEEACVQTAVQLHRKGGSDSSIVSESLGDYSASYRDPGAGGILPGPVLALLTAYRRPLG